jgi:hypothetical protein
MRRIEQYRREFESALPRIERHARVVFRSTRCTHQRADQVAETIALSWHWWLRLRSRGKDPREFVSTIAVFAARAVRSGRRLCGQERSKDVFSGLARQRHGFSLEYLPQATSTSHQKLYASPTGQRENDAFEERLRDNMQTPVPEQAAFRCDFPAWLASYDPRNREIIAVLMAGERTHTVAVRFRVSDARISQLRRAFLESWRRFHGEG